MTPKISSLKHQPFIISHDSAVWTGSARWLFCSTWGWGGCVLRMASSLSWPSPQLGQQAQLGLLSHCPLCGLAWASSQHGRLMVAECFPRGLASTEKVGDASHRKGWAQKRQLHSVSQRKSPGQHRLRLQGELTCHCEEQHRHLGKERTDGSYLWRTLSTKKMPTLERGQNTS